MGTRKCSDEELLRNVGAEIALRRQACGMSQEDLAEICNTHRNSIGRIERGDSDSSVTTVSYLYLALGCEGVYIDQHTIVPFVHDEVPSAVVRELCVMYPATMVRHLSTAVRSRRLAMGMSLQQAAGESRVHLNSIWSFEQGLVRPSITTYFRLLQTLQVNHVTQVDARPVFR